MGHLYKAEFWGPNLYKAGVGVQVFTVKIELSLLFFTRSRKRLSATEGLLDSHALVTGSVSCTDWLCSLVPVRALMRAVHIMCMTGGCANVHSSHFEVLFMTPLKQIFKYIPNLSTH